MKKQGAARKKTRTVGQGCRLYSVPWIAVRAVGRHPAIDGRVFSREGILSLRTSLAGTAAVLTRVVIHNSRSHNMSLLTAKRSKSHRMRQDVVPATLEQEWRRRIREVGEVPQVQAYLYVHLNSSYVSQGLVLRTGGGNERREATAT
ncbi:hypothetical protein C8R44DRAFT_741722 [Mycena epipterygia]|nr:hypothetical protein C8R44DRAFT_741722 [Mycena epipterygia]